MCAKKGDHELESFLISNGISVICYHGDMDKFAKNKSYESFMCSSSNVILATIAFGME